MTYTMGLQSLIPQAYGKGDVELCGLYLNRGVLTTFLIFSPLVVPVYFLSFQFLTGVLGIEEAIALEA